MGAGANWRGGDRAGSKRPRIGARTCVELTRGASDREIRGGGGSVAGGELPLPHARHRELPGLGGRAPRPPRARASSPSREGAGAGALAIARVCVCWLWGLMPRLFVKPPPRLRSYGNEDGDAAQSVYPSPAGREVALLRANVFRISPVVPAVFAN
jgi:hypothetical protein